jgi:hypothetical protein
MQQPSPSVFAQVMQQLERARVRQRIPMWKLDDAALGDRRYKEMLLLGDGPPPRWASWTIVQGIADVLAPRFRVRLVARRRSLPDTVSISARSPRFMGSTKFSYAQRLARRKHLRSIASAGGKASSAKLNPAQRKRRARHAAAIRWQDVRQAVKQPRRQGRPPNAG